MPSAVVPQQDMAYAQPDPASGLQYATRVLEKDGFVDFLAVNEAPRLSQAAGGQFVSHAVLQAQIEDAARVVAATDPSSTPVVTRLRTTMNALVEPPKEPISNTLLSILSTAGTILGLVLGILPAFGFMVSPWIALGVLAVSVFVYLAQLFNNNALVGSRDKQIADHEEAILALLRRADELRAQAAQQARQTAHLTLQSPALPA